MMVTVAAHPANAVDTAADWNHPRLFIDADALADARERWPLPRLLACANEHWAWPQLMMGARLTGPMTIAHANWRLPG